MAFSKSHELNSCRADTHSEAPVHMESLQGIIFLYPLKSDPENSVLKV